MKEQGVRTEATIVKQHTAESFIVRLDEFEIEIPVHRGGKCRYQKPAIGDKCIVEISPYDRRGIIKRLLPNR